MNMSEKLAEIAENVPKVYDAGHNQGLTDVIEKQEEFLTDKPQTYYDAFWDTYQANGRETGVIYSNAFSYSRFNDESYNPKYDIICQTGVTPADMLFYRSGLTSTKVPIYILGSRMSQSFGYNSQLVSIPYLHVNESVTFANNPFQDCSALETLIIGGTIGQNGFNVRWSKKLNKASIESIINALSETTSELTVTLSKTAVNNAFETVKGAADGSTSAEWIALAGNENTEGIRPNWTISLM